MPATITLSESAAIVLSLLIKGIRVPVNDQRRGSLRELVAAGIMEPVPGPGGEPEAGYRFTEEGMARREEIARTELERIERERYAPPDRDISEAAKALLRTCIVGRMPEGDEGNRPAYRELVKARIMIPLGSFSKGNECIFRFTYWGYKQRFELAGMDPVQQTA